VDNLHAVGMQQSKALDHDIKSFENNLLAKLNLPGVSAQQAELVARLNDAEGKITTLRAMLEREGTARQLADDQSREWSEAIRVALAEREGVMRQQFDERISIMQQKMDQERLELLREVQKTKETGSEQVRTNIDQESRERENLQRRVVEMEKELKEERQQRHTMGDVLQDKLAERCRVLEKQVQQEHQKREERENEFQQAFKGARGDLEAARSSFEDIMRSEVRARLQGLEQAENKLEWCINREDATLRSMRAELQAQVSTIEGRVKKAESFFMEQLEVLRTSINDSCKEVGARAAKGHAALEAVVTGVQQRLNTALERLELIQRDNGADADRRTRQLRDEIGDCARVAEQHCEQAVARVRTELQSARRLVDDQLKEVQGLREMQQELDKNIYTTKTRIEDSVAEVKIQCAQHREGAREAAAQACIALERRVDRLGEKNHEAASQNARVQEALKNMEHNAEAVRQAQAELATEMRVSVEHGLKGSMEAMMARCQAQLQQMQEMLEVKIEATQHSVTSKIEAHAVAAGPTTGKAGNGKLELAVQSEMERDLRESCHKDFERLRRQFGRLGKGSWGQDDEESKEASPAATLQQAVEECRPPLTDAQTNQEKVLKHKQEQLSSDFASLLEDLAFPPRQPVRDAQPGGDMTSQPGGDMASQGPPASEASMEDWLDDVPQHDDGRSDGVQDGADSLASYGIAESPQAASKGKAMKNEESVTGGGSQRDALDGEKQVLPPMGEVPDDDDDEDYSVYGGADDGGPEASLEADDGGPDASLGAGNGGPEVAGGDEEGQQTDQDGGLEEEVAEKAAAEEQSEEAAAEEVAAEAHAADSNAATEEGNGDGNSETAEQVSDAEEQDEEQADNTTTETHEQAPAEASPPEVEATTANVDEQAPPEAEAPPEESAAEDVIPEGPADESAQGNQVEDEENTETKTRNENG